MSLELLGVKVIMRAHCILWMRELEDKKVQLHLLWKKSFLWKKNLRCVLR